MTTRIDYLEPDWRPPEVKQLYDELRSEIAKAFTPPEYGFYSSHERTVFMQDAMAATEVMRREMVRLYMMHCFPRILIKSNADA